MALRYLFTTVNHIHLMLKPNNSFWAPFDHNALLRTCSLLHGSPTSSAPPPCGGTSIYMGAHKDDWNITLAQFAVDQHNHKESKHLRYVRVVGASHTPVSSILYHITLEAVDANRPKIYHAVVWLQILKNFMELLVWNPLNHRLSVLNVKCGEYIQVQ